MSGLISWRNWADTATLTPVFGSDTYTVDPNFPLSNLQNRQLSSVCKVTASTGAFVEVAATADLGGYRNVNFLAFLGLRARTPNYVGEGPNGCWFYVECSEYSDFHILDYSASERTWLNPLSGAPSNVFHILPAVNATRYIRAKVRFDAPDSETFLQAGRLWIGDALELPGAVNGGVRSQWSISTIDSGNLDASAGLQTYAARRGIYRRVGMDILCDDVTAFGFDSEATIHYGPPSLSALQMEAGTTGELIALPRSDTGPWTQSIGIYGHLERPFDIQHVAGPNYRANLTVVEER